MLVVPANVLAVCANTQPLMVPASTPLPPAAADIVKLWPARIFPSKVIGPELPTLMVPMVPIIQKILLACAWFCSVNVRAPFTVKAPSVRITKISFGLFCASKTRLMPVVVEISGKANVYTLLPINVRLTVRSAYDCVDVKSFALLNAFTKSM